MKKQLSSVKEKIMKYAENEKKADMIAVYVLIPFLGVLGLVSTGVILTVLYRLASV